MVRFLTSGESHGKGLTVIVEGFPSGVRVSKEFVDGELRRRMAGYGRGGRMRIEADSAEFNSGVRFGKTLGSPICIHIKNLDYKNWKEIMSPFGGRLEEGKRILNPRPGHADLSGVLKRGAEDVRDILERASARETGARVAAGALAKLLIAAFDMSVKSYVTSIGHIRHQRKRFRSGLLAKDTDKDPLRMADEKASREARNHISDAAKRGDSVGGSFEVLGFGVPPGLGDYTHWDKRLDGRLARALVSIPAIKGIEIGDAIDASRKSGAKVHDRIFAGPGSQLYFGKYRLPFRRKTNSAGGIEGGMSNGESLVVRCYMKPIPTLTVPLDTVSIHDFSQTEAVKERSDVCAVPAASVVGESMVAIVMAECMTEKFGGDSLGDMLEAYESYLERICVKS